MGSLGLRTRCGHPNSSCPASARSPCSQGPALHPLTHQQSQLGPGGSQREVLIP